MTSGAFAPSWHADTQNSVIYAFHMPLFFFLSGLFAKKSQEKGAKIFLREKAIYLVYPYFLWSIISGILGLAAAGQTNMAINLSSILNIWSVPIYQYWFLYALLICQILTLLTRADWWVTLMLCGVSAIIIDTNTAGILSIAFKYYLYFGLGILVGPSLLKWEGAPWKMGMVALTGGMIFMGSYIIGDFGADHVVGIIRAVSGGATTIAVAMLFAPRMRWLASLGTASMAIYVMHTIFSSGVRMGARGVGFQYNLTAFALGTVIGILAPLAIWFVARHYRLLPILGFGTQPRHLQGQKT
jgi:fucose 4-O-acetylase-like acetyltransferase